MNWIVRFNFTLVFLLLSSSAAFAEYRAYELEVFDRIVNTSRKVITSFSPSDFIQVNGGSQRIGIIIRASWICYGDTSIYKKVCPMPKAINPRFQDGDRVQIVLKKHLTDQWLGVIENSFFRPGLRSNVYGVRFTERGNLYTRYYESNLKKAP
ncbi:MAG: hypothetical protein HOF14_05580 [Deltaproteobacteria bacterium]|nr:hypothetical protein [Deltaproteobacteria bacterium]MBT4184659.1 hypothetical protein [Deltaproteobacteria bacterium]MBT5486552.1 hypothetical protein [Deltaproteobacteria bacterium]MBT5833982.1 hypothetical protein [Deltaproteobacteria bacterium]